MFDNIIANKRQERLMKEQQQQQVAMTREQTSYQANAQTDAIDIAVQETKADLIKWQQDLGDELFELVLQLKGYKRGSDGNWFVPKDAQPLCNDLFISDVVIPQCRPFISRGFINSNLTEERILMSLKNTCNDIVNMMADGYDIYNIEFIKFDDVMRIIKNVLIPSAFRSLNGWTKKTDSTNFRRIESSYEAAPDTKKKRMFGIGG